MTKKADIIKGLVADRPDLLKNKAAFARQLAEEHPEHFQSVERARSCIRYYTGDIGQHNRERVDAPILQQGPSFLVVDIETAPMIAYSFRKWKTNINDEQIIEDWFMLSWAAKWIGQDTPLGDVVTPEETFSRDDKRICGTLWPLLDAADVIIAHNGDRFDMPKIRSRMLINGYEPFSSVQPIDTLKVLRKEFGFTSNRLDYINKVLGIEGKMETGGFDLWKRCCQGDPEALTLMLKYNVNDVLILEKTYTALRAWIRSHPNYGMYTDSPEPICPVCGSLNLEPDGHYMTNASRFAQFRCADCGAQMRGRASELTTEKRRKLMMPTAR